MPHDCFSYWGARARRLTRLLERTTLRERRAAMKRGGSNLKLRPERPYEGWVHRARRAQDYGSLVELYFELCLAVKQPTDLPNRHGCSALGRVRRTVDARRMGVLARKILLGLEKDGKARNKKTGVPAHHERGHARYGTPNWLEEPPPKRNKGARKKKRKGAKPLRPALLTARDLLESLRSAMDR